MQITHEILGNGEEEGNDYIGWFKFADHNNDLDDVSFAIRQAYRKKGHKNVRLDIHKGTITYDEDSD